MVNVKIITIRQKIGFTAVQVLGTTSVALTGTKTTNYNFHNWTVVSSDPTEIIRIPGSTKAKQTVQNLKKGNTYNFYHYPVTKNGELPPEGPLAVTIV